MSARAFACSRSQLIALSSFKSAFEWKTYAKYWRFIAATKQQHECQLVVDFISFFVVVSVSVSVVAVDVDVVQFHFSLSLTRSHVFSLSICNYLHCYKKNTRNCASTFLQHRGIPIKSDLVSISNLFGLLWSKRTPTYLCCHLSGIIAPVFMFIHEISLLLSLFTSLFVHFVLQNFCFIFFVGRTPSYKYMYNIISNAANVIRFSIQRRQCTATATVCKLGEYGSNEIVSIRFELSGWRIMWSEISRTGQGVSNNCISIDSIEFSFWYVWSERWWENTALMETIESTVKICWSNQYCGWCAHDDTPCEMGLALQKNYKRTARQSYFEIAKDGSAVAVAGAMATADLCKWIKQNQNNSISQLGFHFMALLFGSIWISTFFGLCILIFYADLLTSSVCSMFHKI